MNNQMLTGISNGDPSGNEMFQMKLHDRATIIEYSITRVPGGWIYLHDNHPVFVPLDNEFCTNLYSRDSL